MIKRHASAGLAMLIALGMPAACTPKREPPEVSPPLAPRLAAAPGRCGPGLAAEDLAGNCRDRDCPTMGALEAEPPRPAARPCPQARARAGAPPPASAPARK